MGQRFLSWAGGQIGGQTCAAVQLKGAALGARSVRVRQSAERPPCPHGASGSVRSRPSSFRAGRAGRGGAGPGRGERPLGGELSYLGSTLRTGGLPGRRVGTDPPPSSAAAPLPRFCASDSPASFFSRALRPLSARASLAAGVSALLAAACPAGHRLLAAHSSRHRAAGPAPEEALLGSWSPNETDRAAAPGPQPQRGAGPRFSASNPAST